MSRVCDICNRGTASGNSRSHSNISTRRKFAINLQSKVIDGKRVNLSPGMNITAEIKTGQRRIIEFLLSPVQRAGSESLRER